MRAQAELTKDIVTRTAVPTTIGQGTSMGLTFGGSYRSDRYLLEATLAGGTSCVVQLWGRRGARWSQVVPAAGAIFNAAALPTGQTYSCVVAGIGVYDEIVAVRGTDVGGVTLTASLTSIADVNSR